MLKNKQNFLFRGFVCSEVCKVQNNNISFTAKFISPATVLKSTGTSGYLPKTVSCVELSAKNKQDMQALKELHDLWGEHNYSGAIYDEALCINDFYDDYRPTFYAITKQKDTFEHIKAEDVLGLAETSNTFGAMKSLDYLQTNPKFLHKVQPAFKHVGTAMLNFIESINKGRRIEINSVPEAESFYLKNGYQRLNNDEHVFFFKDV